MRCPADRCRAGTSKERAICEWNFSGFPLGFSDRILVGFGTLECFAMLWKSGESDQTSCKDSQKQKSQV